MTSENDLSLLERVLRSEGDPKIATIMALDLILVGIDTVRVVIGLICSSIYCSFVQLHKEYLILNTSCIIYSLPVLLWVVQKCMW